MNDGAPALRWVYKGEPTRRVEADKSRHTKEVNKMNEELEELKIMQELERKIGPTGQIRLIAVWSGCACCMGDNQDITGTPEYIREEAYRLESAWSGHAEVKVTITGV